MGGREDDERLAAFAEWVERSEHSVLPGVLVQRACDEGPAGAAELLEMTGRARSTRRVRGAAGGRRAGQDAVGSAGPRGQGEPRGPDNRGAVSRRRRGPYRS